MPARSALVGWLAAALLFAGCGTPLTGGRAGSEGDGGPTPDEFLAEAEAYLGALRDGDFDRAWDLVCQEGFGSSDRATFGAHHAATRRPTAWELTYESGGFGGGRSAAPGGGGGTPPGAAGTVELDDGTRGELRLLYGDDGLCQIIGDETVVDAVDPSPDRG